MAAERHAGVIIERTESQLVASLLRIQLAVGPRREKDRMVFNSTLEKLFDQKRTIPETYRKLFEPAISQWSMHDDRKVGCVPPSVDHIAESHSHSFDTNFSSQKLQNQQ